MFQCLFVEMTIDDRFENDVSHLQHLHPRNILQFVMQRSEPNITIANHLNKKKVS